MIGAKRVGAALFVVAVSFAASGCDFFKGSIIRSRISKKVNQTIGCSLASFSTTVDDFQGPFQAEAYGIKQDKDGVLYTFGYSQTVSNRAAIVRKSVDLGETWTTVLDYQFDPGNFSAAYDMVVDSSNNLYLSVVAIDGGGDYHLLILKSADKFSTFGIVDDYQSPSLEGAKMAIDSSNIIYLSTTSSDGVNVNALVRKGTVGGTVWTDVDTFNHSNPTVRDTYSVGIAIDSIGQIYESANAYDAGVSGTNIGFLRRSSDSGNSWTTVDISSYVGDDLYPVAIQTDSKGNVFQLENSGMGINPTLRGGVSAYSIISSSLEGNAYGFYIDPKDNLYALTYGSTMDGSFWYTYKSSDSGSSWTLLEARGFGPAIFRDIYGTGAVINALGDLVMSGIGNMGIFIPRFETRVITCD